MSGFTDENVYPSDEALLSSAAGANTVASLQAGHPFSLLLAEDDGARDAALETLMDTVADTSTRFVRATNPLRARLTLERLLIQVVQGGLDVTQEQPASIIRRIAEQRGDETRVILVIERSETLHPEVLRFFGQAASFFPDGTPRLQLLFVGRPEFQRMLVDPDAGLDEQTQQLEAYRPAVAEPGFAAVPPEQLPEELPRRPPILVDTRISTQLKQVWRKGASTRITIVAATLGGTAAVVFAFYIALTGDDGPVLVDTGTALLEMPEPADSDPDPPVLQPGPPKDEATALLRSEFEAYLIASGRELQNATAGQRRAIYQEFLVWRARTGAPKQ